jgi:hypothetical protein
MKRASLWEWIEVPGTALASVEPAVRPPGWTGPRAKIDAWCGACLRRTNSVYMLGAAGGHADYAGNEVNALRLDVDEPHWEELCPSTPNHLMIDKAQFYLDGRPAATHTYTSTQFIDTLDRMVLVARQGMDAGSLLPDPPAGHPYLGTTQSFSFDYTSREWDPPEFIAPYPGGGSPTASLCAKHPVTCDVYYSRGAGAGWYRWRAGDNVWERLADTGRLPWYAGAAIDPLRDQMLVVGGYSAVPPTVYTLEGRALQKTFSGLGESPLRLTGHPGVVYDEYLDAFLVVYNGPQGQIGVLRVDAESWKVEQPAIAGTPPAYRKNGIHNAVQFVPELGGIVLANRYNGNVYFMRTSD